MTPALQEAVERLRRPAGARPFVLGHRGTRGRQGVVENTLPAFELALDQGADGVELDVRLCGGEVVVLHDQDLARVAGPDSPARVAAESTLAQLQEVPLAGGARVPTLDEVLCAVLPRGTVNVELKPDVPDRGALVAAVARVLARHAQADPGRIFLSSFSRQICAGLCEAVPELPVLRLIGRPLDDTPVLDGLPHAVGVHPRHTLIDAASLPRLRAGQGIVNTWTVNDPTEAIRLAGLGVDAIITDDVPPVLAAVDAGHADARA